MFITAPHDEEFITPLRVDERVEIFSRRVQSTPSARSVNHVTALIAAAPGTVKIQAHTILPATPQRTALKRRVVPTPTIAPEIVCVVDTGIHERGHRERDRAGGLRAESADGLELRDLHAHRANDAPSAAERSESHRGVTREHDPQWNRRTFFAGVNGELVRRDERGRDDAHRFLCVIAPVPERVARIWTRAGACEMSCR